MYFCSHLKLYTVKSFLNVSSLWLLIAHSALYTGGVPDNYLIYVWLAMKNSLYQNNGWSRDLNQHKTDQWSCCLTCCPQRGSGNEGAAQKACSEDKDSVLKGRGLKLDVDKVMET